MKKSYTTLVDATLDIYSGITKYYASGSSVYLDEDYGSDLVDAGILVANTDWTKPVDATLDSAGSDLTYDFDMEGFTGEKLIKIEVAQVDENLPTGSTVVVKVQNAAGTTDYETITLAVGAITAGSSTTFYIKPSALLNPLGVMVNFSGTIKKPAANTADTTVTVTLIDESVASGVIWTIGTEAANVINLGMQLLDSAGAELSDEAGTIEFYLASDNRGLTPVATADTVAIGTDGAIVGTITDKQSYILVSELDGDIDVDITEAVGAATYYAVAVFHDGRKVVSPPIVFAA